jgi:hypothetical protein
VRGDGDDPPPLCARPLRRTEVDADDYVDLERAAKGTNGIMELQLSPLPPTWFRAIRSARKGGPRGQRGSAPAINRLIAAHDHADARSSRDQLSTRKGGHRSSHLASLRPDDEQPGPSKPR